MSLFLQNNYDKLIKVQKYSSCAGLKNDQKFFEFAKLYWGINEIQLLPTGQYHTHKGEVPIYSGTTMDLGNHMINPEEWIKDYNSNEFKNQTSMAGFKKNKDINNNREYETLEIQLKDMEQHLKNMALDNEISSKINYNSRTNRDYNIKNSIGSVKGFFGNFGVLVRAYAYI